jgi:hypothetical protein
MDLQLEDRADRKFEIEVKTKMLNKLLSYDVLAKKGHEKRDA